MSLTCCDKPNVARRINPDKGEYPWFCNNCQKDLVFMSKKDADMLTLGVKALAMATPDRVLRHVALGYHRILKLAATLCLALCMFSGCDPYARPRPDGGVEYRIDDGGWVGAGDPCGCSNIQLQVVEPDYSRTLLECLPNPEYGCEPRDTSCQPSVCLGSGCCVWLEGKP